ncbi:MAG: inverse autotransporter beta domain-containing protein [Cyanobacteriota bacterium]|nr:inverse autotransporter beta domain-containing protein [Cyanobacteriota bacterium]
MQRSQAKEPMPSKRDITVHGVMRSMVSVAFGLGGFAGLNAGLASQPAWALPKPPAVQPSGGLQFQSQGGGTPNTFSGYLFTPLSQSTRGDVVYLDVSANLNLGGALSQQSNVNAGASTRLGYRWLSSDQRWLYGVNAGVDTRQAYSQYAFQAGVGGEALNRHVELRANGYIPFSNQAEKYATGWTNAYLINNQLILDGWNRYVVSLGGVNLEAGLPLHRWGKDSLWLYGSYYYLGGQYVSGSSGVRGRAEVRVGSQLAIGATLSYDNIFQLQATGYLRYGAKPISGNASDAISEAENNFLALRGLPMQRESDIRMVNALQNLPGSIATNPANGSAWVVRCTGATASTYTVNCGYPTLDALLAARGAGDVLLVGGGAASTFAGQPVDANGRPTLRLAPGTQLSGAGSAPTLATQFGPANLTPIFGTPIGAPPSFNTGVVSIGSNTRISGFNFTNTSITNYSTSNVIIANNTFVGSYTDNPTDLATAQAYGAINVSVNALPAIQLDGVSDLIIANNTFNYPQVQVYTSQNGTRPNGDPIPVCNQNSYDQRTGALLPGGNTSGLCLSGNAIRLNNSSNVVISNNTVTGALDEAFRINNPSNNLLISRNTISEMRMGPDSNIGSAIIIGQNQGSSNVVIEDNYIFNNSRGVYPVVNPLLADGKQTVAVANQAGSRLNKNVIDPIEIGLCRGTVSYPRAFDLYASSDFSGNCSTPASMNLTISNNTIRLPRIVGVIDQDGDGIDLNIGANAILNANVVSNDILTLGLPRSKDLGDNGLTFDIRGNSRVNLLIEGNVIRNSDDAAIGFSLQNTNLVNQPGETRIRIAGNVFGSQQEINRSLEIDLVNNIGTPVSQFYVTNTDPEIRLRIRRQNFNSGSYPDLYYNSSSTWQP